MLSQIKSIIDKGEGNTTEFKKCKDACSKSAFETVCSFLNRNGGNLLLGVNDDGNIAGINTDAVEQIKKDFVTAVNNPQKINPPVYLSADEYNIDGKIVLHVFIPESSQVHRCNGRIYDRNEDGDFDITDNTDLAANLFIRKQRTFTENEIFPFAGMNDLKTEVIDRVRIMASNRQPNHPWNSMSNVELLRSAGLIQKDFKTGKEGLTLACLLLFGKDETIVSVLPYHKTDAIMRRKNLDRYDDRDDIRCNLIESYDRLMHFVEKHLDDPFYLEVDVRVSVRNKLFREVVANILIHREYSNPYPAKFIIEGERVITENGNKPHGFGQIDIDNFVPYPKNPVIARVFKEIGWAEELGSGIRNIKKYCKIYSDSKPVFIEGDVFKTIIDVKEVDKIHSNIKKEPISADKVPINADKIIEFLKNNKTITNRQGREITGLSATRVKVIFKTLCDKGILVAHGSNRDRHYTLKMEDYRS